uniref:Uncharacterized protein n=1 Tax=Arcella intermedia TaxID=1963864 RepID=A0A6B2LWT3_9EUKA
MQDTSRAPPGRIQAQHGLQGHISGRHIEPLKDQLQHLLSVVFGIERGLGQQQGVLCCRHLELLEGVLPDELGG